MTTICYRDGILASDTRAYAGWNLPMGQKVKIRQLSDGRLIGASSNMPGTPEAIMDWYEAGANPDETPTGVLGEAVNMIVVHPDGRAQIAYNSFLFTSMLTAPWFVIGSGAKFASGALFHGATAEEAIAAAAYGDEFSALPVTLLTHEVPSPARKSTRRKR